MKRTLLRIVLATALIGAGWSVGKAQTTVAEFEIAIDAPRGAVKVMCYRGCEWAKEGSNPIPTITFPCDSERCRAMFNGHGRITLGMPR